MQPILKKTCKAVISDHTIQIQMPFFVFRTMRDYTVLDVGPNRYDGASAIYFESLVVVCKITYIWKPKEFFVPRRNVDGKEGKRLGRIVSKTMQGCAQ